jgi:hypothetical protein
MVALLANVTDLSMVDEVFHVPEFVDVPAAAVDIAVAPVEPPATAAARLARSPMSAALIAMVSPAETDVEVIPTLVWLDMLSSPVNSAFQLDACTVSPAETVEIVAWFNPYSPAPGPAKWL